MSMEIRSRTLEATRCSRASVAARLPGRSRSKITERISPSGSSIAVGPALVEEAREGPGLRR